MFPSADPSFSFFFWRSPPFFYVKPMLSGADRLLFWLGILVSHLRPPQFLPPLFPSLPPAAFLWTSVPTIFRRSPLFTLRFFACSSSRSAPCALPDLVEPRQGITARSMVLQVSSSSFLFLFFFERSSCRSRFYSPTPNPPNRPPSSANPPWAPFPFYRSKGDRAAWICFVHPFACDFFN